MKLSARNIIKGKVTQVKTGAVAAQVTVDIGGGNVITSTIPVDAVEDLGLSEGKDVSAIIKSSDVIIGA